MNLENEIAFGEFRFFGVMSQTPISTLSITLEVAGKSFGLHLLLKPFEKKYAQTLLLCLLVGEDGAVLRALASNQCGPGSNSGVDAIGGSRLLFLLCLAPRVFSLGTPVFRSAQKSTLPNSNAI